MQIFLTQISDALSLLYDIISLLKVSIDGKIHKLEIVSHCFLFIKLFVRGCFWLSLHSFFLQTIYSFNFQRIKCYLKLLATITVIADIFNTVLQCTLTEYICFKVTAKSISNYRPFILGLHSHHVLTFTLAHLQPAINCCNLRWNRFRKLRVLRTFCYEDLLLHFRSCCVGLSADDMESLPLLEFKKEKIIFCIWHQTKKLSGPGV